MNIQDLHDIDISGSRKEVARYRCESSLYEFLRRAWKWVDPSPFADGWPIEAVAEHLEAVCDGDIKRLIVNIPPRFGKSTVCSVAFPAWIWAQRFKSPTSGPGVQFLTASYAAQLSVRDSVKCRRLIDSPWYQELWGDRFKLASDQNVKSRFDNDHGGSRLSTSVGSALTGEGGNCFPAWVKVSTPGGYRPIANVFAGDMVLAFDHSLGKVVNSRVIAARQLKTDELYEIRTVSGYSFQCTGNHPVFVSGRGYIRADSLGSGDTVIVERGQANSVAPALRQLREGNHEAIVRGQKGFEAGQQGRLLLQKVLFGSSRIQKLKGLCDLWRWAVSWACGGLLKRMRGPETVGQAQEKKLSNLQKDICWPKYVLLREMRGPCPFRKNDGNKQCKLQVFGKILQSIQIHAANCFGAGRVFLPGVWAFAAGNSVGEKIPHEFAHSPHRRKQPEQSSRKLDNTLPDMPQASPFWGADVIQTVECYSGPEISVYDIQVEGCSNFFANGVLVHNCIIVDDPNGAQDATSEAVIESTIEWFDNALSTRLNDPKSGAIIIIQQRLAENDLTGHILEKQVGDWTHLCYDEDTEILSRRGWIPFSELQEGESVMGVNPETLDASWEIPTSYVRKQYSGDMIAYKSLTANLKVTPDHRMVYGDSNDMNGGKCSRWRVKPASMLPRDFYLPQVVSWRGSSEDIQFGGRTWNATAFAEFMGWYLSEGCSNAKERSTRIVQKIGGRYVDEIDRVMKSVPFHVGRYKNSSTMYCWQIKDRHLAAALEPLGKSKTKYAPESLKCLTPELLRLFLLAYAKGDGNLARRNSLKVTISTASKKMADDLQECAIKAGWSASLSVCNSVGGRLFNGRILPDCVVYKVYIRASKSIGLERKISSKIRAVNTTKTPYDGMVYCVSVPSTAIVVRRGGKVSVSGNCLPMKFERDRSFTTVIGWKDPRTNEGELLWPERFGEPEVKALEKTLGPWAAAGQLQQRPEPKGGGVIKRDWWQLWPSDNYPPVEYIIASLDTAYTTKTENDYSALTVWGVFSGSNTVAATKYVNRESGLIDQSEQTVLFDKALEQRFQIKVGGDENTIPKVMCMMAWAERLELHDLIKKVSETCKTYKVDKLLIENKGSGISVAQEVRRLYSHENFAVQLVDPKGQDKLARLHSVAHLFAEGMIYAPDRDWADKLITQVSQFPRGKHDDLVDTVSMAIRHLRDAGLLVRSPEWAAEVKSAMAHTGNDLQPLY